MRNVLVISYYWPPSGGVGVQRTLKFCKYLKRFNWNPIVLTVENGEFPSIDQSLKKDAIGIECHKVEAISFYKIFKFFSKDNHILTNQLTPSKSDGVFKKFSRWARYNLIIPDGRVGWYWRALQIGIKIMKEKKIHAIFSSGPPHSSHLIARSLSKKTGVFWVADFRDPWIDSWFYFENPRNKFISFVDSKLEKSVLKTCNRLVTVSEGFFRLLNKEGIIERKSEIIHNGYDPDDFSIDNLKYRKNNDIIISHIGTLIKSQNPVGLFKSIKKYNLTKSKKIKLRLIGSVHSLIDDSINKNGLEQYTLKKTFLNHNEAIKHMIESDLLFLVIPNLKNSEGIIPAKLYEYIATRKKIIIIGDKNSDAALILKKVGLGYFFDINDYINFDDIIIDNEKDVDIDLYSRINQTKKLAEVFNDSFK